MTAEAVAGSLDLARSGRKEIQRQREEDVLLKVLPLLNDGLSIHDCSEMIIACFTVAVILASKSQLADKVLDSIMEAVAGALETDTINAGLICLSILTQKKSDQSVTRRISAKLAKVNDLETRLQSLRKAYDVETFTLALIRSALLDMRAKEQSERLTFVERLLFADLMDPTKVAVALRALLTLLGSAVEDAVSTALRESVADLLRKLNDSDKFTSLLANVVRQSGLKAAIVEAGLRVMINEPEIIPVEVDEMDVDLRTSGRAQSPFPRALEHVPQRTVDEHSFLSHSPSHLFGPLLEAFTLAAQSKEATQSFAQLPLWRSSTGPDKPLFASFFIRIFSGPYPIQVRHSALSSLGKWLSELSDFDSQAILPYVLLQLADPVQIIRQAASEVMLALDQAFPSGFVAGEVFMQWGLTELYSSGKNDQPLTFLPTKEVSKIIQRAVVPALEECVLDPTQIKRILQTALKPGSSNTRVNAKTESTELKKYLRQNFFRLLLMHLSSTPLYSVKTGVLDLLTNVDKVGGIQKRKELMPLLLHWASLTPEEVENLASNEHLDAKGVSATICGIISPTENDAVDILLDFTSSINPRRSDFMSAVSERIQHIWLQLKTDRQIATADSLLRLTFHDQAKRSDRSQIGRHVFQSVDLSTDVLIHLLDSVRTSINAASEHSPVSKKRRNNENQAVVVNRSPSEAKLANVREVTFVLELVDNLNPERRPELLSSLFHILAALHQLKVRHHADLSYLLSLSLSSLLGIVRNATLHLSKVDLLAVRVDVVIDCMRTTQSPQVQNTSLLLIAAVASIAPERVLDSIMPVFTFIGTDMLGKDDEYSSYVVDQIMDQIIPPLIQSLRSRGRDLVTETSDLMSILTVAYEHIPPQRRFRLFKKLVSNLDDEIFLSVLISSLAQRYADRADVVSFIISLINTFEMEIQLKTCANILVFVEDALASQSGHQKTVAGSDDARDNTSPTLVLSLLRILDEILTVSNITSKIARSNQSTKSEMEGLMPMWKDLLDKTIIMVQTPDLDDVLRRAAKMVLSSLLSLIPMVSFIDIAEHFVDAGPDIARRRVLRQLEDRLRGRVERSAAVQTKALTFLEKLLRLLNGSEDGISKHAAIACVDRICELYGRKDVTTVVQAARVISGDSCLGSSDTKINILVLLCLSSATELVKDAIVPIVPQMMPKVFKLLQTSLEEGSEDSKLHDAAFTLTSALLAHVPFIVSDEYLDQILVLSAESSNSPLNAESNEIRGQALQLIDKNIALANIIGSLRRTCATTVENDVPAVLQALSLLAGSVKASPKSVVVKNAEKIAALLLQVFDLRRVQFTNRTEDSYTDDDVSEIEKTINSVTIEIIYKLNDSTFRPMFLQMVDWATVCPDVKSSNLSKAQKLRQTTLFNFLAHFFNTLKSIVTSYATHIVEPAVTVLKEICTTSLSLSASAASLSSKPKSHRHPSSPVDQDALPLYLTTLAALHAALRHDHDAHFSIPSHFTPLAESLVVQLHLASHPTYNPHIRSAVIPTIVALATAVVDTHEHLKKINSLICGLRRAEDAKVRLGSVWVHLALAGAEQDRVGGAGEEELGIAVEWCGTVLSVGEGMVYVNEMLEDEDEEVESGVRRLVRRVRECVGEEGIFE